MAMGVPWYKTVSTGLPLKLKLGVLSTRFKSIKAMPPGTRDCFGNAPAKGEQSISKESDIRVKIDGIK